METITSKIVSQHSVKLGNHTLPMFYINYEPKLVPILGQHVTSTIENNTLYNGSYPSSIYSSGSFPSLRPNFFMKHKYLVVLVHIPWKGYSTTTGDVAITFDPTRSSLNDHHDKKFIYDTEVNFEEVEPQQMENIDGHPVNEQNTSSNDIIRTYIYVCVLGVMITLLCIEIYNTQL